MKRPSLDERIELLRTEYVRVRPTSHGEPYTHDQIKRLALEVGLEDLASWVDGARISDGLPRLPTGHVKCIKTRADAGPPEVPL